MPRKLIAALTGLIPLLIMGAVWWGVVEAAGADLSRQTPPLPPTPSRQGFGASDASAPDAPDISFIDSPTAQCYQPEQHKDTCYIQWYYQYVTASSGQYIISMTVDIDNRMRAYYSGFFQTAMIVPPDMSTPGFEVRCGTPGSGGNPNLGMSYSYVIRARETGGLGAANYGSVTCPFDIVPPETISLTGPTDGLPNTPYTYTAYVNPLTTTIPLIYSWRVSDHSDITTTGGITDAQTFTWNTTGLKQIVVQASNLAGSAVMTQTINISNYTPTPTPTPTATPTATPPVGGHHDYLPLIITGGQSSSTGSSLVESLARAPVLAPVLRLLGLLP